MLAASRSEVVTCRSQVAIPIVTPIVTPIAIPIAIPIVTPAVTRSANAWTRSSSGRVTTGW